MDKPVPAYKATEPYVFVCYAHADEAVVYSEMRWLQEQGIRLWYDAGISGGAVWRAEIADAIRGATHVLVYLSKASVASPHCLREIDYALDQGVAVLPVYVDDVPLPSGLDLALNRVQALRRANTDTYRADLVSALGAEVPRTSAPPNRGRSTVVVGSTALAVLAVAAGSWFLLEPRSDGDVPAPTRSVSVVPFEPMERDATTQTLATGLTEDVVALLSSYQELRTLDYAGGTSSASYLLRASLQPRRAIHRIRARLHRVGDGQAVWSDDFDINATDDEGQSRLSRSIARFVRLQLVRDQECESIKRASTSLEAAENLCAALAENYRVNQGGNVDWERQFGYAQRALALDPGLPDSYWMVAVHFIARAKDRDLPLGRTMLARGLEIAPNDPMLLQILAWYVHLRLDLNYALAEETLNQAIEVDPLHPLVHWQYGVLGMVALHQGKVREAIAWYSRAVAVFDADARIWWEYALALQAAGRDQESIVATDAGLELVSMGLLHDVLIAQKASGLIALDRASEANDLVESVALTAEGRMLAMSAVGRVPDVEAALREVDLSTTDTAILALAYLTLGDTAKAFEQLHRAIDVRDQTTLMGLRTLRGWAPLRGDPRWLELMQHLESEEAKGAAAKG